MYNICMYNCIMYNSQRVITWIKCDAASCDNHDPVDCAHYNLIILLVVCAAVINEVDDNISGGLWLRSTGAPPPLGKLGMCKLMLGDPLCWIWRILPATLLISAFHGPLAEYPYLSLFVRCLLVPLWWIRTILPETLLISSFHFDFTLYIQGNSCSTGESS